MVVNPFWFGVLLTIVGLIVAVLIIAFVNAKRHEAEDEVADDVLMAEDAFKKMLADAVAEALRQNMFGFSVEDHDDQDH